MFKWIFIKTDFKKLIREPMMALLFLVPILIPALFWALLTFLVPFIQRFAAFDITPYHPYILSMVLIFVPGILGVVMGFMLLDDKDGHITELMSVTPMGIGGYMLIRLAFVFAGTFIYILYSYALLGLYLISIQTLIFLAAVLSLYGASIGILLYSIAEDKVKGLTYAKGLNLVMLFALADLVKLNWIKAFSALFPPYWITRIITAPEHWTNYVFAVIVHTFWLVLLLYRFNRSVKRF